MANKKSFLIALFDSIIRVLQSMHLCSIMNSVFTIEVSITLNVAEILNLSPEFLCNHLAMKIPSV